MITIIAEDDKVFYSRFANLQEFEQADLDEGLLSLSELKYLLKAIESKRLRTDPTSLSVLQSTINSRSSNGSGSLDPSLLLSKEDNTNKTDTIGAGSSVLYPTTKAVVSYVAGATTSFITSSSLTPYAFETSVQQLEQTKADKNTLNDYATKAELAEYPKTADVLVSLEEQAEGLESQIALKADVSVLSGYATKDDLSEAFNDIPQDIATQLDTKLNKPVETAPETVTTPTVDSVPLYTLDNNGAYVLCTPDAWLNINGYLVPAYNQSTIVGA